MAEELSRQQNPPPNPPAQSAPSTSGDPDVERKIAELEMKLQQEREKVLLANLKASEDATTAAKVEASIKDVQEKLRRDRRDAEREESRLKLEAKIQELESRLVQERETWVATLKNQMHNREMQDAEIESNFTGRIQEMERRWLEEKAHWQRAVLSKDEEIRNAKALVERLRGLDLEYQKGVQEKKFLEDRCHQLMQENASLEARAAGAMERERDYFQLKAELDRARDQARTLQEKMERELEHVSLAFTGKEDRLLADNDRLRSDLLAAAQKARAEYEMEIRRIKEDAEAEIRKARVSADMATATLQRMRAVCLALEKQAAALRIQAQEAHKLRDEVKGVNERYKAEFLVLQRKWQEREAEIRKQAKEDAAKEMETEKIKIKFRVQEEIKERIAKVEGDLRKEMEARYLERERALRAETQQLEGRKQEEMNRLDKAWQEGLFKKDSEILALRASLDRKEEQWKALESRLAALEEDLRRATQEAEELKARLAARERMESESSQEMSRLKEELKAAKENPAKPGPAATPPA